jgi:hypothetical protein
MPRKTAIKKNPSVNHAINNLRTVKQIRDWFESAPFKTDGLTDGQVKALKNELIVLGYGDYTAGQLPPKVFYNALNFATGRKTNPTDFFIEKFSLGGKMYAQIIEKSDHTFDMYIYQMQSTGVKGEGNYEQFFDSKNYKTKSGAMRGLEKWAKQHKYSVTPQLHNNPRKKTVSQKRNPSGEIGAYEITKNFKVLGIFKTKADAIKAAQGISDATGKTLAVKPVQVLAGHFDK